MWMMWRFVFVGCGRGSFDLFPGREGSSAAGGGGGGDGPEAGVALGRRGGESALFMRVRAREMERYA